MFSSEFGNSELGSESEELDNTEVDQDSTELYIGVDTKRKHKFGRRCVMVQQIVHFTHPVLKFHRILTAVLLLTLPVLKLIYSELFFCRSMF